MVSWAAGRRAGGSRLRLLDGADDPTARNRLELLEGVAEAYVISNFFSDAWLFVLNLS